VSAAEAISLPKGGGALSGIGETFQPDLQTGTGNLTVPIELPPGRNGLAPPAGRIPRRSRRAKSVASSPGC